MRYFLTILILITFNKSFASFDITKTLHFRKLKCGLFINDSGDIGFKTQYLIDDMGNNDERYQTMAYLTDENDTLNDGIIEFKDIVDTSTFEILNDYYCKDKKYVYAIFYTSDGATFNISKKIDAKTFSVYANSSYGSDKQNIYFRTNPINKAERKSFNHIENDPNAAFDNRNFYFFGEIISMKEAKERQYIKKK